MVGQIQAGLAPKAVRFEPYNPLIALSARHRADVGRDGAHRQGPVEARHRQIDRSNIGGPIQIATEAARQAQRGPAVGWRCSWPSSA